MNKPENKDSKPIQPDPRIPKPEPSRTQLKRELGFELAELARRKDLFRQS